MKLMGAFLLCIMLMLGSRAKHYLNRTEPWTEEGRILAVVHGDGVHSRAFGYLHGGPMARRTKHSCAEGGDQAVFAIGGRKGGR